MIGGRGPNNILVKKNGHNVEIDFSLLMSPLEKFIYENFEDSENYLTDMYKRIHNIFLRNLLECLKKECALFCEDTLFDIDINKGNYKLTYQTKI